MSTPIQEQTNMPAKVEPTISEKFLMKVERQFTAELGQSVQWTPLQRTLAQHLYLKIDAQFKVLNEKRGPGDQITWDKVDMVKLALSAVNRVSLGLDALIPNHISPIPYKNSKTGLYDLDLRIGYEGLAYCKPKMAIDEPASVRYELVHETDHFRPILKDFRNPVESYEFDIKSPFGRGAVVGGFGYIEHEDIRKNQLVLVTLRDFEKSYSHAQSKDYWGMHIVGGTWGVPFVHPESGEKVGADKLKSQLEMMYKTVVLRTTAEIPVDPAKVNGVTWTAIRAAEDDAMEAEIAEEVAENANQIVLSPATEEKLGEIIEENSGDGDKGLGF